MDTLVMVLTTFAGYILMYKLYGNFIGKKVFAISQTAPVPSKELQDDIDYVPTKKEIIFGHHFTSIAGTGPIVGPAIAIIWGWLPALLWVFVGSIVMGAVHDLGSLIISMRNQGKSISEYSGKYINPRIKIAFFAIVFLELWIVIAIFGLVIAVIFSMYPGAVLPVWLEVFIAMWLGYMVYKKGKSILLWSIIAIVFMYITVIMGAYLPISMPDFGGIPATGWWTIALLIYAFIASILPVTSLLQPRDYINSHQLVIAMALLIIGVFAAAFSSSGLKLVAPAIQTNPIDAPSMWPFLFITIACGAISGFHSLVSSGTSSKQVQSEQDAVFVGYGSMLMESALAILVIAATAAGIGMGYKGLIGTEAWSTHYASWAAAGGLASKITAFVVGAANMIESAGIPHHIAIIIMGVFVASFAGTTMDTATRIQRYVVTEFFESMDIKIMTNRYAATFFAVFTAAILAFTTGADGKGALKLWPLFGAVNQTLAALALFVITIYLRRKGRALWLFAGLPAIFMATMTLWASVENQISFVLANHFLLALVNGFVIVLVIWITIESIISFFR